MENNLYWQLQERCQQALYIDFKLALTAVSNNNCLSGFATVATDLLDISDDIGSLADFSKYDVLSVQPTSNCGGDKELAAVGVGSAVGHREQHWLVVSSLEVFVGKLFTVDGFAAGAVLSSKVATLAHEAWDDSVERRAFVTKTFLASTQSSKILDGLWHIGIVHVENDSTSWATANGHVKEALDHFESRRVSVSST